MRKSSDGSKDRGKDRLKALAAAAARAAGANLTTYFADDDSRSPRGSEELPAAEQGPPQQNGPPVKLVHANAPPQPPATEPQPQPQPQQQQQPEPVPMTQEAPQPQPATGEPQVLLRLVKPEEADVVAKQSARMARLITSGDGTLLQCEPSTSGELPPHIGPPGRQNSLEFLPVLPPMHVHSHPVTTGHGQYGQTPPQVFVRPEDDNKPLPKIVLAQSPGGRSPPMNRAGSGGPSSPPPQVTISVRRDPPAEGMDMDEGTPNGPLFNPQRSGSQPGGPSGGRRRTKHPGLPPLNGGRSSGKKGKRGGASGGAEPQWQAPPQEPAPGGPTPDSVEAIAAAALHTPAALPPGVAIGPMQRMLLDGSTTAGPGCDVPMGPEGSAPLATQSMKALTLESAPSSSTSPFANAPAAQTSSEESDTESDEKQANSESAGKRRADAGDAPRGAKRVKGNSGAARAASLNTVLAAVEEQRAGRQGSAALDAAVGCAPTTVEDCLQASSFGVIRKDKRSAKGPRPDNSNRVWGATFNQGMGSASQGSARPVTPPSSQPIASLSSSESAAAISLLALAPGTPPGMSSPQGAPMLQPSASCSGEFSAVPLQQQLAGPAVAAQGPAAGQGQAAEPMDSDMLPAGQHEQQAPQQQAQPMAAGTESAAATERQQQSGASAGAGSNGAANGQAGANGAQSANGAPASAGLPIAPLRLDSGLQAQEPSEGPPEMSMGLWSGKLKHRMATAGGYSTVDLLNLTALIPDRYLEQLPPTLFVTELLARSAVQMSKHYIVQCRLGFLTDRQLTKLQLLANSKLVAVCQLQHCKLTLVPYLEARSGQLRLMGFLIADDLGT